MKCIRGEKKVGVPSPKGGPQPASLGGKKLKKKIKTVLCGARLAWTPQNVAGGLGTILFFKTCILLISKTTVGLETSLFLRGEVISKLPELTYS
jgi:hypothetical protein